MKPFPLMKRAEIVSFYHLQMPRWLFADPNYKQLSLHAKVAYTFLLNRYQLSQRNGWVNEDDEVYVIFTRAELADEMADQLQESDRMLRGIAGREADLGGRRGRGLPNHIYLAQVEQEAPQRDTCAPFTEPCAGSAGLEADEDFEQSTESFEENAESVVDARSQAQKEQGLDLS